MDALLQYPRPRQILEVDDLVATFVENELGRHDWMNNWPAYKVKYPNYLDKIRNYFSQVGEQVNPEEIARHIDNMIVAQPGKWR